MLPLQLAGLALAGRALLTKYNNYKPDTQREPGSGTQNQASKNMVIPMAIANSLESLSKTLTSSFSQLKESASKLNRKTESYYTIAKKFVPENTKLLLPESPSYTREIHLSDIDGDLSEELITSFKLNDEIRTVILKKQNDSWYTAAEITNNEYEILDHRSVADLTGAGKKQLILGLSSRGKPSQVYGYSLENGKTNELFSRNYDRLDVLRESKNRAAQSKAELGVWTRQNDGTYNIEVLGWNGLRLEPVENITTYYNEKAIPYFVQRIRKEPYTVCNWCNLADALVKAGTKRDALTAIDTGMALDRNSKFKNKFTELKNKIK